MSQSYPTANGLPSSESGPLARVLAPVRVVGRRADLVALALLLALPLLLLIRQILLGGALFDYDMELMSIPVYSWYADALRQGRLPIWSPQVAGGAPLAFAIYGFFYPPDVLLYRLLDAARAFHLSLALHVALAGLCTYWYCRVLGFRRLPSLVAAVGFEMGTQVLAWQSNGFITRTLFLLPGLLAVVELVLARDLRYWLLAPPLVAAALLGGYAQLVLYGLAAAGAYALLLAVGAPDRPRFRALLLLGAGVGLGFGLAAVRAAPTLAFLTLSTRGTGMDLGRSAIDSIEPWALVVGHLLPPALELAGRSVNGPDSVGVLILLLATLAVGSWRRLGRRGWFHATLAVVATVVTLGEHTPVYESLLSVPFFSLFRGPDRFSCLAGLAIAVLAAHALDRRLALGLSPSGRGYRTMAALATVAGMAGALGLALSIAFQFGPDPLSENLRRAAVAGRWDLLNLFRPRMAVAALGLVAAPLLLLLCARGRISHRSLEWSALALTCATLFLLGWVHNRWLPPAALYEPPALARALESEREPYRIFAWAPRQSTYNVGLFYSGQMGFEAPTPEFEERYLRQFIPPNLGMLFGIATAEWYDALQTRRQALAGNYMGSERAEMAARYADGDLVDWDTRSLSLHARLDFLAAMNVKYLTTAFPIEDPRLEKVDEVSVRIYPQHPAMARVHLYRLVNALPRVFVAPHALVLPREQEVLDALLAGRTDLRERVILEEEEPSLAVPRLSPSLSQVRIVEYGEDRVEIAARTDGSGFLVLMDFLLPGWTATVDGRAEPILAGNFAGRAVPLPGPGEHRIVFSYQPPWLREGLAITLLSLALFAAAAGYLLRRGQTTRI